jgi:callose synthase
MLALMVAPMLGAADGTCCWCDPKTPASASTIRGPTDNNEYKLIFSDEFNDPGRQFGNGNDAKWTALEVGDTSNQGAAFYLPGQASITDDLGESSLLILTENVSHTGDSPTGEKNIKMPFRSAMLQSWNKFCFTGGIVEWRARQPRGAGYWPALWLFGNLGRAVYQDSNTGLWPWSYDKCDADLELPPTDPPQRISACDDHDYESTGLHAYQGRGATELDVLEGAVTNTGKKSYSVGSLQLSPGVPQYFKPPLFGFPTVEGAGKWYTGLSFGTGGTAQTDGVVNNGWYGPPWGSSCPTGCPDALSAGIVGLDDLDTRYWKYAMEWKTGADGYLKWYYDGVFVWGMSAASFGEYTICESRGGKRECKRTPPRQIPNEPMSLVMNTAIGSWNGGKSALDGQHWPAKFFVDYVRVWQSEENVGCDPPDYPTRKYIEKNTWMFGEAVKPVGYDTCPESYPKAAYDNAEKIRARAATNRKRTSATSSLVSETPSYLFSQSFASPAASTGGTVAPDKASGGGGTPLAALLAMAGFAATLAAGKTWGVRVERAARQPWPLASVDTDYAEMSH